MVMSLFTAIGTPIKTEAKIGCLSQFPSYFLRQHISQNLAATDSAKLSSKPRDPPDSTSPVLGLQVQDTTPTLCVHARMYKTWVLGIESRS